MLRWFGLSYSVFSQTRSSFGQKSCFTCASPAGHSASRAATGSALAAGAAGWGLWLVAGRLNPVIAGAAVLVPYALVYGALTLLFRIPTAQALATQVLRRA